MESGLRPFVLLLFVVLISRFGISSAGCNDQTDNCTCVSNTVMENLVQQASSLAQWLKDLKGITNSSTQSLEQFLKGDTNASLQFLEQSLDGDTNSSTQSLEQSFQGDTNTSSQFLEQLLDGDTNSSTHSLEQSLEGVTNFSTQSLEQSLEGDTNSLTQSLEQSLEGDTNSSTQSLEQSLIEETNASTESLTPAQDVEKNGTLEAESMNRAEGEGHDLQRQVAELREELKMTQVQLSALQNNSKPFKTPVAFSVRFTGAGRNRKGRTIPHRTRLRFDRVGFNDGEGYDPKTGIFTAPMAGEYLFFLDSMGTSPGTLFITKGGSILERVWSSSIWLGGGSMTQQKLKEGDKIWVTSCGGIRVLGGWHTDFNGYLLKAD